MTIEHAHAGEVDCPCTTDMRRAPWWEDDELVRRLAARDRRWQRMVDESWKVARSRREEDSR